MAAPLLPPFAITVQSGALAAREALGQLLERLEPLSLDVEEAGLVELVLAETLNNIVEHAYPENASCAPIRIACSHEADGLHLRISDKGRAMPDGKLPLGLPGDLDVAQKDLPEGGFGWFMIHGLAKDMAYARVGAENHLSLRLAVAIPG